MNGDRGVFALARGIFDHPVFKPEPFTEVQAWVWLIENAVWQDTRVRAGKAVLDLKRGQLAYATRFLATKWRWKSEGRVRRFLDRLKNEAMIEVLTTHEATRITICNYDKWQFGRRTDVSETDARADAVPTRERRKEEELKKDNNQEEKKEPRASALIADDWPDDHQQRFWNRYPHKVGKPKALAKLNAARKRGVSWLVLMAGLERYIRDKPADRAWLNPETFLNQERWADQPAMVRSTGPPRGPQGFESLFQQPETPDDHAARSEFDLDIAAN